VIRCACLAVLFVPSTASAQADQVGHALDQLSSPSASAQAILGSACVLLVLAVIALFVLYTREQAGRLADAKQAKIDADAATKAAKDEADRKAAAFTDFAIRASDALMRSSEALRTNTEALTRRGGT
jgi:uncharacterized membrane protein